MTLSMSPAGFLALLLSIASSSVVAQNSAAAVKPGLWETTTTIENAAAGSKRSIVGRTCVAAAEASTLARMIPTQHEFGMQCENRDLRQDGTNVTWSISCRSAETTQTGKGKMALFSDSYLGTAEVELRKRGSKPVKLTQSFSGKWLKPCS